MIAAMVGASTLTFSAQSFAAEQVEKKLSKKERKALKIRNEKLGRMSSMCIGSLAMLTVRDNSISETPTFKSSQSFWDANLAKATSHLKTNKVQKVKISYRSAGRQSLLKLGNGDILSGGEKASLICSMIEAEGLDGPTASMMLKGFP